MPATAVNTEDSTLREIVDRIVRVAAPERVVLFGSAARGQAGVNSDLDFLVVKSGVHRRRLAMDIHRALRGVGRAVDIVVVTPGDLERYGSCQALVIEPALREGVEVYAR